MLNFVKNILKPKPSLPKLSNGENYSIDLSGIKLSFKKPNELFDFSENSTFDTKYNIHDPSLYQPYERNKKTTSESELSAHCIYGGNIVFEGALLHTSIAIKKSSHIKDLFKKKNLEKLIDTYLNTRFGPDSKKGSKGRRFECPLFWEIKTYNDIFITFDFKIMSMSYNGGTEILIEQFINDFMSHVEFSFTPSIKADIDKLSTEKTKDTYSNKKDPLPWVIYDSDPLFFYDKDDIEYLEEKLENVERAILEGKPKYSYLSNRDGYPVINTKDFDYEKEKELLILHRDKIRDAGHYHMDLVHRTKVKNITDLNIV